MIRRVSACLAMLLLLAGSTAWADELLPPPPPEATKQRDESLRQYRTPYEVLMERMIGTASKSVRFDWRKTTLGVAVFASDILELNNFSSAAVGGLVRIPVAGMALDIGTTKVFTWGSDSSRKLAMTPYRQHGRPGRLELNINLSFPLAEGVVTAWPGFFPATELVFSATGGLRYLYYWGELDGMKFRKGALAVFSPRLTDKELDNIDDDRLPGMVVDVARYNAMLGLTCDIYFQNGFFVFPRALVALPFFATSLGYWWELSMGLGFAL